MRINYLSPRGVLEVEHAALRELEAKLPRDWGAYAAFRLVTRGSKQPLDIDLLLLTTNRILVVELKNWSGDIEYSAGQWFHRGDPMASPVDITDNKARVLRKFIQEKNASLKVPFVESLVVLCHPKCRLMNFPTSNAASSQCFPTSYMPHPTRLATRSAFPTSRRRGTIDR